MLAVVGKDSLALYEWLTTLEHSIGASEARRLLPHQHQIIFFLVRSRFGRVEKVEYIALLVFDSQTWWLSIDRIAFNSCLPIVDVDFVIKR